MAPETVTAHGTTYVRIDLVKERYAVDMFGEADTSGKVIRFGEFWAAWKPRGGRKTGKAQALAQYTKAVRSGVSEATLISAAVAYGKDNAYPKDAFRWIRDQNYADEVEQDRPAGIDALKYWADLINGSKRIFGGVSPAIVGELIRTNMVSHARMEKRGLI